MLGFRRTPSRAVAPSIAQQRLAALDSSLGPSGASPARAPTGAGAVDFDESPRPEPSAPVGRRAGRHAAPSLAPLRTLALTAQQLTLLALGVAAVVALAAWWVIRSAPHAESVQLAREQVTLSGSSGPEGASSSPPGVAAPSAAVPTPGSASAGTVGAAAEVVVDVAGRVRRPGIVELPAGSRVVDALRAAGGPRHHVDTSALNLARPLVDGEQIVVGVDVPIAAPAPAVSASSPTGAIAPVDVNTATLEQLDTLPGIGPVTAQAIIDWRTQNGAFTSVDELLEVSGIGDPTLT
jgi:competence protein ComEA